MGISTRNLFHPPRHFALVYQVLLSVPDSCVLDCKKALEDEVLGSQDQQNSQVAKWFKGNYCWWFRNPNNHLGWCWKPINKGINYQPQLVSQISAINSMLVDHGVFLPSDDPAVPPFFVSSGHVFTHRAPKRSPFNRRNCQEVFPG